MIETIEQKKSVVDEHFNTLYDENEMLMMVSKKEFEYNRENISLHYKFIIYGRVLEERENLVGLYLVLVPSLESLNEKSRSNVLGRVGEKDERLDWRYLDVSECGFYVSMLDHITECEEDKFDLTEIDTVVDKLHYIVEYCNTLETLSYFEIKGLWGMI